nr:DUF4145 domain-containing protein [Candidatus Sigynarchaeum springense]
MEVPAEVIGTRPWFLSVSLWTRAIELCIDWQNGIPKKAPFDFLVPDPVFREMRARVEQFLYRKNPALVDGTPKASRGSSEMATVIDTLHKIDWQKMESLGLVKPGAEPENLIGMLTNHSEDTLVKMRALLEQMVNHAINIFCSKKASDANTATISTKSDLYEKIKCLADHKAVQSVVANAMHAIRTAGNIKAHQTLDIDDPKNYILATALHFVQVAEWFITTYTG